MNVVLKTIQVNYQGDSSLGSIHCRRGSGLPISDIYTYAAGTTMYGVFVLPKMNPLGCSMEITVDIAEVSPGDTITLYLTKSGQSDVFFYGEERYSEVKTIDHNGTYSIVLNYMPVHSSQEYCVCYQNSYTISYQRGVDPKVPLGQVDCVSYGLSATPLTPFNVVKGAYVATNENYVPTQLLDFVIAAQSANANAPLVTALTKFLNSMARACYDTQQGACHYYISCTWPSTPTRVSHGIRLNKFLANWRSGNIYYLNCSDCAAIVQTAARVVGVLCYSATMANPQPTLGFKTNPIITIGGNQWLPAFGGNGFSYHCVNILTDPLQGYTVPAISAPIYDACLSLDSGNDPIGTTYAKIPLVPADYSFGWETWNNVELCVLPFIDQFYRPRVVAQGEQCTWSLQYSLSYLDVSLNELHGLDENLSTPLDTRILAQLSRWGLSENPFTLEHFLGAPNPIVHHQELCGWFSEDVLVEILDQGLRYKDWVFRTEQGVHRVHIIDTCTRKDLYHSLITTLSGYTYSNIIPYEKLENYVAFWGEHQWILLVRGCQIIAVVGADAQELAKYIVAL